MQQAKTEAIILDSRDVFDTDRIYLMYTREFGKLWVRAKGVRKPTSKLTGHLLAYVPTQLELVRAGQGYIVAQAQTLAAAGSSPYPDNVLDFTRVMGVVGEVVDGLSAEHDSQPRLYDVIKQGIMLLTAFMQQGEPVGLPLVEVLIKILASLGYQPELYTDIVTGEPLKEGELGWSDSLGGVVQLPAQVEGMVTPLGFSRTVVLLRQFLEPNFQSTRLKVPEEVALEAMGVINSYVQYQLGRPIKALQYLSNKV